LNYSEINMARILIIAACLCGFSQAQNTPAPQPKKQPAQSEQNPFEPIPPPPPQTIGPGGIEGVDFRGSRQFSQDTLRRAILSKVGDAYNEDAVRRDVMILRNTNRFEDVRVSIEEGKKGGVILRFFVTERPPAH
jgi:outer membrane protein assembly factor BamA